MDNKLYQRAFFALLLLLLMAITFLMIKPYLSPILFAMVLAYLFYPVYRKVAAALRRKSLAAFLTAVVIVLVIALPFVIIAKTISQESYATYIVAKQKIESGALLEHCTQTGSLSCRVVNQIVEQSNHPRVKTVLASVFEKSSTNITKSVASTLAKIPVFLMHTFIMLYLLFFLFRDGPKLLDRVERIMPLNEKHRKDVMKKLNDMTHAVIYGSIMVAVFQGAVGTIGFIIFGIPAPFLWGMFMVLFALIPYVGAAAIWLPAALYLILKGYALAQTSLIVKGVLLILYGIFVISIIDNILKPKIIGQRGGLHPALVLLGVIGGLQFFGFVGVMVGPILLALFVAFLTIYEEEKTISEGV